jgi:HSP20 family protein
LLDDSFGFPCGARGRASTSANLHETPDAFVVELPLPGVKPEDVELTVKENVLVLQAKREWQAPEGAKTIWQGFRGGQWEQRFTLPGEVNPDKVSASLEYGVLRLELPKAEHTKPRTIRINASGTQAAEVTSAPGPDEARIEAASNA